MQNCHFLKSICDIGTPPLHIAPQKGGWVQIARTNLYAIFESPLTQEREPHIIQMFIYIEEVKCVIKVIIFIFVTYLLYIITYT